MASSSIATSINHFDMLPDELIIHIFQFMSVENILICEQVSERWKRLALDPYIWRLIKIVHTGQHRAFEYRSLDIINSHCKYISNLRLTYVHNNYLLKTVLTTCQESNLIFLELWTCRIDNDFPDDLKVWRNLRKLSLRNSIRLHDDNEIVISFDQFEDLRYLELSEFGLNNNNCITLVKLKRLKHIHIDKIKDLNLHKENMIELINSKIDILESLHIYGGKQVDDHVLIMLSKCPNLKKLSIKFCEELTDHGLKSLINLKKLKHLQIWNNTSFTENCLLKVLGNPVMFQLQLLSMSRINNITRPIIEIMCNNYTNLSFLALYQCPKLVEPDEHTEMIRQKFGNIEVIYE